MGDGCMVKCEKYIHKMDLCSVFLQILHRTDMRRLIVIH